MERIEMYKELFVENPNTFTPKQIKMICEKRPSFMRKVFASKDVRRAIKKGMKEYIRRYGYEAETHPELINSWIRDVYDGEGADLTWVIRGNIDDAKRVLDQLGEPWEGVSINSPYDCTGQWFRYRACFYELSDRVFVCQSARLDV